MFGSNISSKAILILILVCTFSVCNQVLADNFKITYPKSDDTVNGKIIEIEGTGAEPNTKIVVSVFTDEWYLQKGKYDINKLGEWTYSPCYLKGTGEYNHHKIKAELIKNGEIIATTKVRNIVRNE